MTYQQPDAKGFYGKFGGQFVPETLMTAVIELDKAYREAKEDSSFQAELDDLLKNYVGRETPLYHAKRLTDYIGGAQIYLKREDLNHTGAHKINNALGQVLLAKRMGKKKIIAETGAGQHGVATATAAALFDMDCTIYMGEEDVKRQALNVFRMELLGAKVFSVTDGSRVLKDAVNAALRAWVAVSRILTTSWDLPLVQHHSQKLFVISNLLSVVKPNANMQRFLAGNCLML